MSRAALVDAHPASSIFLRSPAASVAFLCFTRLLLKAK
jgi:hypothetical protein